MSRNVSDAVLAVGALLTGLFIAVTAILTAVLPVAIMAMICIALYRYLAA